jgi:hypothetical protein
MQNDIPTQPYPRTESEKGQPEPDLGEKTGELITEGEGENEKPDKPSTGKQPTTPKGAMDEDESNIDPDIKRDVEAGRENAA